MLEDDQARRNGGNCEVRAENFESLIVKLPGVVQYDNLENSKSAHNALPDEIPGVPLSDFGKRFNLYSFGEIINSDD